MTPWQRRVRLAVAAFGIVLTVVVVFAIRRREPVVQAPVVQRIDPKAVVESVKGILTQAKGGRENFNVEYERSTSYEGGAAKFFGVKVITENRGGRSYVITGREADVSPNQTDVTIKGDVVMKVSDGLEARAAEATYTSGDGIVRAPGRVTFTRGGLTGAGVGMTYDKNRDVLWLLDQADVRMKPDAKGAGAFHVTAGAAGLARADKYLNFERTVKMTRGGQVIEAENAIAHLSDDEKRVTALELRGGARITAARRPAPGALRQMTAGEMSLVVAEDGETLQRATLAGTSVVELAGPPRGRGARVAADALDIGLAPDGATMTSLVGRDHVQAEFAAEPNAPTRAVKSVSLDALGEGDKGLSAARFADEVEYREVIPGKPPVVRVVKARLLEAEVRPGLTAVENAKFSGAVRFEEGDLRASSALARYNVATGTVELSGLEGAARPEVSDPQIHVEARNIRLTFEGRRLRASRDVRTTLQPSKDRAKTTRRPGLLEQDQPISVHADTLEYDGGAGRALYTGEAQPAQLWQGDTTVKAGTIELDDNKGDLRAKVAVRSTWVVEPTAVPAKQTDAATQKPDAETKKPEKVATIASAEELLYEDELRRATYTTSAHVNGPEGDLTADRIELYLKRDGNELERAEAYDKVTVRLEGRSATGTRLTYFAVDERYLMAGAPVTIVEECRETTGKLLTFYKTDDRILVDGKEVQRAQTKTGGKCP